MAHYNRRVNSAITPPHDHVDTLGFSPKRLERLHRCLDRFVGEGKHAGISMLVLRRGQVADVFATGLQDRAFGIPMQRDTIVRIYSMTKIVVSVAALILLEEGKLGLLDPVENIFRSLAIPRSSSGPARRVLNSLLPTNRSRFFICSPILLASSTKPQENQSVKSIEEPVWKTRIRLLKWCDAWRCFL